MKFRPPKRPTLAQAIGALPMTSMIDVVFLLLIFFLVTARFTSPEQWLSAGVVTERAGEGVTDLEPQIVSVELADGAPVYRIGGRSTTSLDTLRAVLEGLPKEPGVAVRASDDAPIDAAVAAMQAAIDAGFTRRSYVTHSSD